MKKITATTALSILAFLCAAHAQLTNETPIEWVAVPPAGPVQPGASFEVKLGATIQEDWHLYSATQPPGGPNPTRFSLAPGSPFTIGKRVRQSPPTTDFDPNFGIQTEYFAAAAEFWITLTSAHVAKPGTYDVRVEVVYQVCNDQVCLPPARVPIPFKVKLASGSPPPQPTAATTVHAAAQSAATTVKPSGPKPSSAAPSGTVTATKPGATETSIPSIQTAAGMGTAREVEEARIRGFLPFLWLAMTMGAISLATPCVFPMIPITVSYFTKRAETHRSGGIKQALVYCFGIIFTFTILGLGLAAMLGATGINRFAADPWINLLITAIFLGFALNLFGLYEIGIPSSVLTKLSKVRGEAGYAQALLMGLTFTLTSFTCTVPFVGTVLVATSQGDWLWPALGMLGFSVVFAAPFFLLALLPRLLTSLPKSGGWLNSVKVTMGFLEVAAAMKFLSNVDLVWDWHIFTREVVLAVWISIAILTTIYLLGKFQLPYDNPVERLGVVRLLWAIFFLAIAFHLFTGLLGGSLGELDAFLPPRTSGALTLTGSGGRGQALTWQTNLTTALKEARQQQRALFVDFTGYTCTNCRWMEANIFTLPAVHAELEKYVRLQLFTDGVGKQYEENQRYQKEKYGTIALPLYVILDSQGNKRATFPGMTRRPEEFLRFLRTPFGNP